MIHATISIRVAYDASTGHTKKAIRDFLYDSVDKAVAGGMLAEGEMVVEEWEHDVEVAP